MSFTPRARIWETCNAPGTGIVTLLGAHGANYRAFSAALSNGDTIHYCIADRDDTKFEEGLGTYTGGTLVRSAGNVTDGSSGAGVLVNFSSGTQDVFGVHPARMTLGTGIQWNDGTTELAARDNSILSFGDNIFPSATNLFSEIVAIGDSILNSQTTGSVIDVVAIGDEIMFGIGGTSNMDGIAAIGAAHLGRISSATLTSIVAIGQNAFQNVTSGVIDECIAIGASVFVSPTTGTLTTSIGIGDSTGSGLTSGDHNTFLGHAAKGTSGAASYQTAIGAGAICTANNQVMLGRSNETVAHPGPSTLVGNQTLGDGTANTSITVTTSTSGAGKTLTVTGSSAASGSGANGGDLVHMVGAGDGAGKSGYHLFKGPGTATFYLAIGGTTSSFAALRWTSGASSQISATLADGSDFASINAKFFICNNSGAFTSAIDGVLRATYNDLSTAGWLQNTAGETVLANNFTNATNTLNNTNISFTVLSGRSYRIEGYLKVSNSTAGEGVQFDFNGGSAGATAYDLSIMGTEGTLTLGVTTTTALGTALTITSATGGHVKISGYFKPSGNGTFILRFAENSAHASGTATLSAGSWVALWDSVPV